MIRKEHVALAVLWGKSDAEGSMNLLLQHLLDTASVGECLWDRYLARSVRNQLDACSKGQGRKLLALLCGLHDVGKATPAFQSKVPELAEPVQGVGLTWEPLSKESQRWHHSTAGAVIVQRVLGQAGWDVTSIAFVWPLIAGHHGLVPDERIFDLSRAGKRGQGLGEPWAGAQDALVHAVADALLVDLGTIVPGWLPSRAQQLAIAGLVIMADWIASGKGFPGVSDIAQVSMVSARKRASDAVERLRIRGGWSDRPYQPVPDLIADRFGRNSRASQAAAVTIAEQMPGPGLLMIEAPMGEGKTEAALAAAEIIARRFGADGIFVGMPTQATSDPMFSRVRRWANSIEADLPVGLLHGKRRFNKEWSELRKLSFAGIDEAGRDEYGCDDIYSVGSSSQRVPDLVPAEWFLGPKRGLLMPLTVGTIDHLLHAATRTKHVMLRHAGLSGRVVILDEVHAYGVYTSQFLFEALRWLGGAHVSTILLSATLPPPLRRELLRAYVQGASGKAMVEIGGSAAPHGYPVLRSAGVANGEPWFLGAEAPPWRPPTTVRVEAVPEGPRGDHEAIANLVQDALADGGCALVIRNTVRRAQQTYQAIKSALGDDVVLLHARLTVGERADRTKWVLDRLGPPEDESVSRPHRLVVVATQLAEQSFDVDADILVTDLAPIDLLLQRIGRIHRHSRPDGARPPRVSTPRVVVVGMKPVVGGVPIFPVGSERIYSRHLLLRSAALVGEACDDNGWSIPEDVPDLVSRGYGDEDVTPASWSETVAEARREWADAEDKRRSRAEPFLLAGEGRLRIPTLAGLHGKATGDLRDEDAVAAVVRDGPESIEVVLVRSGERNYLTLGGRRMGVNGEAVADAAIAEEVIASTIRLPAQDALTVAAKEQLRPLAGWTTDSWLRHSRALVLDEKLTATLGGRLLTYDPELGLLDQQTP